MKLLSVVAVLAAAVIPSGMAVAQDVKPPNPAVEARTVQALLNVRSQLRPSSNNVRVQMRSLSAWQVRKPRYQLAKSLAYLGRTEEALATLGAHQDRLERNEVLRLSARRLAKLGKTQEAANLAARMVPSNGRADIHFVLARIYLQRGEKARARQTLLQAEPFLKENAFATAYLGYLLARIGDRATGLRFIQRADKLALAEARKTPPPGERFKNSEGEYVASRLFNAGFFNEWKKHPARSVESIDVHEIEPLVKSGHTEQLIRLAEEYVAKPGEHELPLKIANAVFAVTGDAGRLSKLMPLIERNIEATLAKPKADLNIVESAQRAMGLAGIALLFQDMGEDAKAQAWLDKAVANADPQLKLSVQITHWMTPVYRMIYPGDKPLSLAQLEEIIAKVDPLLGQEKNQPLVANTHQLLFQALLKLQAHDAAKQRLILYEKVVFDNVESSQWSVFRDGTYVAEGWKKLDDLPHAHKLLAVLTAESWPANSLPPTYRSQRERIQAILICGFIDEGEKLLTDLPGGIKEREDFYSLALAHARHHPDQFPNWIANLKNPDQRLFALICYSRSLTLPIFGSTGDDEFELWDNGMYTQV